MASRTMGLVFGLALGALVLFGGASTASAQRSGRPAPHVITLDEFRIEGRVQRPNAFYILNRSSTSYQVLDLRTSFVREIVRSVRGEPF